VIFGIITLISTGVVFFNNQQQATLEQPALALNPARTLIFNHHTHTFYSDGELSLEEITELAYFNGCDAVTITDHSGVKNSSPVEKFERIEELRAKCPGLEIFGGLELGMPSYKYREYVDILVPPVIEKDIIPEIISTI
jgi:hypothetical protein